MFGLNENTKDGLKKKEEQEFNNDNQLVNIENCEIEDDNEEDDNEKN